MLKRIRKLLSLAVNSRWKRGLICASRVSHKIPNYTRSYHNLAMSEKLIVTSAKSHKVKETPIWIMRQAGRYLPEFRSIRSQHEFFKICRTPTLAAEITLQPIKRYNFLDAAIIFSDILVIPQAVGMDVQMLKGEGPKFTKPLVRDGERVESLRLEVVKERVNELKFDTKFCLNQLEYVFKALKTTKVELPTDKTLIGFSGAPWTLLAYMIEGGGSKTFSKAKSFILKFSDLSKEVLSKLTDLIIEFLCMQIESGAEIVQVFDSWAGELGSLFEEFSLPYLEQIAKGVKGKLDVQMTLFAKGAKVEKLFGLGYDVYGVDWTNEPKDVVNSALEVLDKNPEKTLCLQGNLDPCLLFAPKDRLIRETEKMVKGFLDGVLKNNRLGYICNLGHGILPETNPENVAVFLDTVKRVSRDMLKQ